MRSDGKGELFLLISFRMQIRFVKTAGTPQKEQGAQKKVTYGFLACRSRAVFF